MKQIGNKNNNVMIGSVDGGSSVTISQNHHVSPSLAEQHIEYKVDNFNGFEEYTQNHVIKRVLLSLSPATASCLGIYADVFSLASYLGLSKFGVTFAAIFGSVLIAVMNIKYFLLLKLPRSNSSASWVMGSFVEKGSNGKYLLYKKNASCLYPRCDGEVNIVQAPPREKTNHEFVGVCSIGGKQHTYTYDYNGIGYPRQFDWRSLEKEAT